MPGVPCPVCQFHMRDPFFIFFALFVFATGLYARVEMAGGASAGVIASSLFLDTVLIALIFGAARLGLGRLSDDMPLHLQVIVTFLMTAVSGGLGAMFLLTAREVVPLSQVPRIHPTIVVFYALLMAVFHNVHYMWMRHARIAAARAAAVSEAERRAALSDLRRLRTQIQPHFLFNVLNNIQVEIGNSPDQAQRMLATLGDHLRQQLELEDTLFVSLDADIVSVRSFIALQQMRFGIRIDLQLEVSRSAGRQQVPAFLLLPLVENATKFGSRKPGAHLEIRIHGDMDGHRLRLAVSQPGDLSARRADVPGTQTGLVNLRARLELHYPGRHGFELVQDGDRVVARITMEGPPC